MKWIEYREKLGIGFNDDTKFRFLLIKIQNFVKSSVGSSYEQQSYFRYCQTVGELYSNKVAPSYALCASFEKSGSTADLISRYIAFANTYTSSYSALKYNWIKKSDIDKFLTQSLNDLNIPFETFEDEEGVFVFPKGASELDSALVSQPLEWLNRYPNAHKTYVIALKQYFEGVYIRDVADNLRKALEAFLQEFLGNTKNLESNKNEICKHLSDKGVDVGIVGLFQPLINAYKNINDRIAKHNDAVDAKLLEFLLYQTGVLIRMVLSVDHS